MIGSHFREKKGFAPDIICFSGSSSMVRKKTRKEKKMLSTHSSFEAFCPRSSENRTKCVIGRVAGGGKQGAVGGASWLHVEMDGMRLRGPLC